MCVYTYVYIPLLSTYAYISPRTWDLQGRRGESGISERRPLYIHHQESMSWYVCVYMCVYTSSNWICIHISTNLGPAMVRAAALRHSLCISITKHRRVDMVVYTYIYISPQTTHTSTNYTCICTSTNLYTYIQELYIHLHECETNKGAMVRVVSWDTSIAHAIPNIDTGWRRLIGSPKLQIIFHKRAIKYTWWE